MNGRSETADEMSSIEGLLREQRVLAPTEEFRRSALIQGDQAAAVLRRADTERGAPLDADARP